MKDWVTLLTFSYPHEAHLAKGRLESEGIEVQITDELTVQAYNLYSNAIGGVKLMVRMNDLQSAQQILVDAGYLHVPKQNDHKFLSWIDKFTARFPLIGKTSLEIRMLTLTVTVLFLIISPIFLLSMPSSMEKLTGNSWCVDKLYYKGQELTPNSLGLKVISYFDNCSERMSFNKNGTVNFPGINSDRISALWSLRHDSLIIYPPPNVKDYRLGDDLELIESENKTPMENSIFHGNYVFQINNNVISMKSDSLSIIGRAYRFNFRF